MAGTKYIEKISQTEPISSFIIDDIVNVNLSHYESEAEPDVAPTLLKKLFPANIFLNKLIPLPVDFDGNNNPFRDDPNADQPDVKATLKRIIPHDLIDRGPLKKCRKFNDITIDVAEANAKKQPDVKETLKRTIPHDLTDRGPLEKRRKLNNITIDVITERL